MHIRLGCIVALVILLTHLSGLHAYDPKARWLSKKPIVQKIQVHGNEFIETDRIKEEIATQEQGFWQNIGLKSKNRLRKDSRDLDGAAINYLYRSHGYLDVQYEFDYSVGEDSTAIVDIFIDEGEQYYIDSVVLPADLGRKKKQIGKLTDQLDSGDVYNPYKIDAVSEAIKGVYANQGYPYAKIDFDPRARADSKYHRIVVFSIDPGPLTIFGTIRVDSLNHTSSRVVRRELTFKPGDLYSRKKLIDSRQRIYSTGLFTYVDFKTDTPEDSVDTSPRLVITCNEKQPRFVRIKTGAAQDTIYDLVWDLAFEGGSRNIGGMGRKFRFNPSMTFQVVSGWRIVDEQFGFHYTEPWPFGLRMPLSFSFVWEPRLRRSEQNYKIETFRISLSTARETGRYTRIRNGFDFEKIDITGVAEDDLDDFKRDQDITESRSVWFILERDSRLNIFVPTQGAVTRLVAQFYGKVLGGDKNFYKLVGEWSRYQRLDRWDIYAFRIKSGYARSMVASDYIPVIDRFYLGGANTIRGYKENSVGPKADNGEPTGGKFYVITNHEIRRHIIGKFWASLFLDIGQNFEDIDAFRFENLLASAGIGVQYVTPLGPLRLDYGQRIAWKPVSGGGRLHITILYAF